MAGPFSSMTSAVPQQYTEEFAALHNSARNIQPCVCVCSFLAMDSFEHKSTEVVRPQEFQVADLAATTNVCMWKA